MYICSLIHWGHGGLEEESCGLALLRCSSCAASCTAAYASCTSSWGGGNVAHATDKGNLAGAAGGALDLAAAAAVVCAGVQSLGADAKDLGKAAVGGGGSGNAGHFESIV